MKTIKDIEKKYLNDLQIPASNCQQTSGLTSVFQKNCLLSLGNVDVGFLLVGIPPEVILLNESVDAPLGGNKEDYNRRN
jgi:hypothetical protein